ncbi:hypothetical protein H0H92_013517 [Tricholoma furcatifolium]|nr:hypothetical protein H0H92_013517 [Tricholoma furcatifolium]
MDELTLSASAFLNAHTRTSEESLGQTSNLDAYVVSQASHWVSSTEFSPEPGIMSSSELNSEVIRVCTQLVRDIFASGEKYEKFLSYRGDAAQDLLDLLQKVKNLSFNPGYHLADGSACLLVIGPCVTEAKLAPRCFILNDVTYLKEEDRWRAGRYGDVYKAHYQGKFICLKMIKIYQKTDQATLRKVQKAFTREAVIWGQLRHPNILPFYGICHPINIKSRKQTDEFSLVSPWITNGNALEFLRDSEHSANRLRLAKYLHKHGVVHGDLKCENILVAEKNQAVIADFGLSYVSDSNGLELEDRHNLSSGHDAGSIQGFEAPEHVENPELRRTPASDVFSFGLVCYQIFTTPPIPEPGTLPVSKVQFQLLNRDNGPIQQPQGYAGRGLSDKIWELITGCTSREVKDRPKASEIADRLPPSEYFKKWTYPSRPDFETSTGKADLTIAKASVHLRKI